MSCYVMLWVGSQADIPEIPVAENRLKPAQIRSNEKLMILCLPCQGAGGGWADIPGITGDGEPTQTGNIPHHPAAAGRQH